MIDAVRNFGIGMGRRLAAQPRHARLALEFALAAVLLVQGARLGMLFLERPDSGPAPKSSAAARPVDFSVFQRFDAFFRTGGQSSLAEATAADSGQMRLFGVRADGSGGGSAIIGLADGRQLSVAVGETVEPGLVLQAVSSDHVVLARGQALTRLIFSDLPLGSAQPPAPPAAPQVLSPQPPAPAPATAQTASDLAAEAGLRPRMKGLRIDGFTVTGPAGGALASAGLRTGDVVLAVNGQRLDSPARIAGLREQLADSAGLELRVERGGREQTLALGGTAR